MTAVACTPSEFCAGRREIVAAGSKHAENLSKLTRGSLLTLRRIKLCSTGLWRLIYRLTAIENSSEGAVQVLDLTRLKMKWHSFQYNFGWPVYVPLFDGWLARCAITVPLIGYLILFNDSVATHLQFQRLAPSTESVAGITGSTRLKLLYLGLLLVGVAAVLYRWRRPWPMRIATNQYDFIDRGLKNFSLSTYMQFHSDIRHSDRDAYTTHGKYYDSEWEAFLEAASGWKKDASIKDAVAGAGHWNEAKSRYESLLRSIMIETFFREAYHRRRFSLVTCLAISAFGYLLLAIPSIDLFIKVMAVIVSPGAPA